ncbi:MAG TPA: hypothetical protein VGB85_11575 [Nannocystis sp.]
MLARLTVTLLLSLAACASHEGPTPTPTPEPEPRAEVQVAIASVQLAQDCPDPASDATATPSTAGQAYAPPPPAMPADEPAAGYQSQQEPAARATAKQRMAPGAAIGGTGWNPPCTQSTMQLSLANTGGRSGKLEIKAVRLLDGETKRALGPIASRKPGEWNAEGTYRPWNEQIAARSTTKIAYRLAEPDWGQVQQQLGATVNLYGRPFILEVEVAVDGRSQTIRSSEFMREEIHMVVT